MLVFAPCGSGKSYFVENYAGDLEIEDGDVILEAGGIKNRNCFWYGNYPEERNSIKCALLERVAEGKIVLYSGSPLILRPEIIVLPPSKLRWKRVTSRVGYQPTRAQFMREEEAYRTATRHTKTVGTFEEFIKHISEM